MNRACICGKCNDKEDNQYFRNVLQIKTAKGEIKKYYGKAATNKMKDQFGQVATVMLLAMATGKQITVCATNEEWSVIQEDCEESITNILHEIVEQLD